MKPPKNNFDRAASGGCVARLVRNLRFRSVMVFGSLNSSPCDDQKDPLNYKQKVYHKFRTLAGFLGGIGIILCFGIVWVISVFVCFLWGNAKEVISPTEKVKHEQYEKELDHRRNTGAIDHPSVGICSDYGQTAIK